MELYALDTRFDELYQTGKPIAAATTNAYAEISGLQVPANIPLPYVLVIDGTNAIDRNTDQAPVIKKLVTVITQEMLNSGEPVYATPYTTLAYHMLRLDPKGGGLQGDGLQATYYNDMSFTNVAMKRVDPSINFSWGTGSPAGSVNADRFSVRWTGMIESEQAGNYKFYTSTDDGVRLWVNDTLIVDHWSGQAETEHSGSISLAAGQKYPIRMEYYDSGRGAAAKLSWSGPNLSKTIIPQANLFSQATSDTRVTDPFIGDAMVAYNQEIIQAVSFGMSPVANIFTTPPIVTGSTSTLDQQQLVVHYRAAIEALSSLLYEMSLASSGVTADAMLEKLALDIYNDGKVDGEPSGINAQIIFRDPMTVDIANTQYMVQDIVSLMDAERALIGNAGNVVFLKDSIPVNLQSIVVSSTLLPDPSTENSIVSDPNNTSVSDNVGNGAAVLSVDFEGRARGAYKESDLRSDFRVGKEGYNSEAVHGPDWGSLDIVADPANTGRGQVMRVIHRAGHKGASNNAGGMRFRADLPKSTEYYFAYDYYIPSNWWQPLQAKIPGLINGTMLEASHPTGVATGPDELKAFTAIYQFHSNAAYGRGDGSLAGYYYDKKTTSGVDWAYNNAAPKISENTYRMPKGRWVTIEQRVKLNTVNVKNGILQIWVDGVLVTDTQTHLWISDTATVSNANRKIDGIWMTDYYGGSDVSANSPPADQYAYYDNFVVSTSPITH